MKFNINSGKIVVSDPCYENGVECRHLIENALVGVWVAEVRLSDEGSWGQRVSELVIRHESCKLTVEPYSLESSDIGVDSGQAGFFDADAYRKDELIIKTPEFDLGDHGKGDGDKWYSACCDLTLSNERAGVVAETGVVSSSGFGDGCYQLFVSTNTDGKVIAAKIVFIGPEEEEEEDECWGCNNPESECTCCQECGKGDCDGECQNEPEED
jgi:hypothetical protein